MSVSPAAASLVTLEATLEGRADVVPGAVDRGTRMDPGVVQRRHRRVTARGVIELRSERD
jgi:hypothetical protein